MTPREEAAAPPPRVAAMMPADGGVLLSKAGTPPEAGARAATRRLPPVLLRQVGTRVRVIASLILASLVFGWIIGNLIEGQLGGEFARAGEWGPPVFMIAASLAMLAAVRWGQVASGRFGTAVLAYEVAISAALAVSTYYDTFTTMPVVLIETDVVGVTPVALWMLGFTVIVPSEPRRALLALLLSASAVPAVYLFEARAGRAPALDPVQFTLVFVAPYLAVTVIAYVAARVIYRLGEDVSRAREAGSYRLEERLGQGGMGEVWRARHRLLARPAAVKLIRAESLGLDRTRAAELVARFEREAQATALLQSPHTVEVYDFGTTEDGAFYYVMELLDGIDLEQLVRRFGPLPPERVVHVLRQVCQSLGEAHRRDLVHRDIKPANIVLCQRALQDDFVKVLDFGLVKRGSESASPADLRLTRAGMIHGTPAYLAPEVARGDEVVDGRADLYAVGCVAYWLLTGRHVFERDTYQAMLVAHAAQPPSPPSLHASQPIPPALDALVLACLAKEPGDRVPSAELLEARLAAVEVAAPWTPERAAAWWRAYQAAAAPWHADAGA